MLTKSARSSLLRNRFAALRAQRVFVPRVPAVPSVHVWRKPAQDVSEPLPADFTPAPVAEFVPATPSDFTLSPEDRAECEFVCDMMTAVHTAFTSRLALPWRG